MMSKIRSQDYINALRRLRAPSIDIRGSLLQPTVPDGGSGSSSSARRWAGDGQHVGRRAFHGTLSDTEKDIEHIEGGAMEVSAESTGKEIATPTAPPMGASFRVKTILEKVDPAWLPARRRAIRSLAYRIAREEAAANKELWGIGRPAPPVETPASSEPAQSRIVTEEIDMRAWDLRPGSGYVTGQIQTDILTPAFSMIALKSSELGETPSVSLDYLLAPDDPKDARRPVFGADLLRARIRLRPDITPEQARTVFRSLTARRLLEIFRTPQRGMMKTLSFAEFMGPKFPWDEWLGQNSGLARRARKARTRKPLVGRFSRHSASSSPVSTTASELPHSPHQESSGPLSGDSSSVPDSLPISTSSSPSVGPSGTAPAARPLSSKLESGPASTQIRSSEDPITNETFWISCRLPGAAKPWATSALIKALRSFSFSRSEKRKLLHEDPVGPNIPNQSHHEGVTLASLFFPDGIPSPALAQVEKMSVLLRPGLDLPRAQYLLARARDVLQADIDSAEAGQKRARKRRPLHWLDGVRKRNFAVNIFIDDETSVLQGSAASEIRPLATLPAISRTSRRHSLVKEGEKNSVVSSGNTDSSPSPTINGIIPRSAADEQSKSLGNRDFQYLALPHTLISDDLAAMLAQRLGETLSRVALPTAVASAPRTRAAQSSTSPATEGGPELVQIATSSRNGCTPYVSDGIAGKNAVATVTDSSDTIIPPSDRHDESFDSGNSKRPSTNLPWRVMWLRSILQPDSEFNASRGTQAARRIAKMASQPVDPRLRFGILLRPGWTSKRARAAVRTDLEECFNRIGGAEATQSSMLDGKPRVRIPFMDLFGDKMKWTEWARGDTLLANYVNGQRRARERVKHFRLTWERYWRVLDSWKPMLDSGKPLATERANQNHDNNVGDKGKESDNIDAESIGQQSTLQSSAASIPSTSPRLSGLSIPPPSSLSSGVHAIPMSPAALSAHPSATKENAGKETQNLQDTEYGSVSLSKQPGLGRSSIPSSKLRRRLYSARESMRHERGPGASAIRGPSSLTPFPPSRSAAVSSKTVGRGRIGLKESSVKRYNVLDVLSAELAKSGSVVKTRKRSAVSYSTGQGWDGPRPSWGLKDVRDVYAVGGFTTQAVAAMSTQAGNSVEASDDATNDSTPIPEEAIAAAAKVPMDAMPNPPGTQEVVEPEDLQGIPDPATLNEAWTEAQALEEERGMRTKRKLPSSLLDIDDDVVEGAQSGAVAKPATKARGWTELKASDVVLEEVKPIHDAKVARLRPGLTRALFSPGVHFLQDPRTGVYNFPPDALQFVPKPEEFAFDRGPTFIPPSQDVDLREMATKYNVQFRGSTSSLTKILSHLYFAISGFKDPDTSSLSQAFAAEPKSLTLGAMLPAAVVLRRKDDLWAIDSDKQFDVPNILSQYGVLMERMLTSQTAEDFRQFLKSSDTPARYLGREAYLYQRSGSLLMRSQLDCYDPRLPGHGTFDIKTRAVFPLRHDRANWIENSKYEIGKVEGYMESFEREYYDLIRATMLKYSFQARIGKMDGIFLAYHNTAKILGFEYLPMSKIDEVMYGSTELADQAFKLCVGLTETILREIVDASSSMDERVSEIRVVLRTKNSPTTTVRRNGQVVDIWIEPKLRPEVQDMFQKTNPKAISRVAPKAPPLTSTDIASFKTRKEQGVRPPPAAQTASPAQAQAAPLPPDPVLQHIQLRLDSYLDGEKHVAPMSFSVWESERAEQSWSVKYSLERSGLTPAAQLIARSSRQSALKDQVSLMQLAIPEGTTVQEMEAAQQNSTEAVTMLWKEPTMRVKTIRQDAQASGMKAAERRKLWRIPGGEALFSWEAGE